MDDYYFDTSYIYKGKEYQMAWLYLDSKCLYKEEDEDIFDDNTDEVKDKYRFEMDHYLLDKIYKFLKRPPSGSLIKTEWKEYDRGDAPSIEYACLKYYYKSHLKSHQEYSKKLDKLYSSKKFEKECRKNFEKAFEEYKKENFDESE